MLHVRYLHNTPVFQCRDLSIRGIGIREVMPRSFISRPSTGDFLFMVFHDPVEWGVGGLRQQLQPGTIVFWWPGDGHHYGNRTTTWRHSWIHCAGKYVGKTLREADTPRAQPFQLSDPTLVVRHLLHLHEELTLPATPDEWIVRSALLLLIREASRGRRGAQSDARPRKSVPADLLRVMNLLNARYAEPLTLDRLAGEARLSVPHFCTKFRRQFGVTPMAYLVQRRLDVAATLLRDTAEPVGDVGARVGYPDPPHFSKVFRNHFGVPPSTLREKRG